MKVTKVNGQGYHISVKVLGVTYILELIEPYGDKTAFDRNKTRVVNLYWPSVTKATRPEEMRIISSVYSDLVSIANRWLSESDPNPVWLAVKSLKESEKEISPAS